MVSHRPKRAWFKLETDVKQHHHHAEFGKMLQFLGFGPYEAQDRSNDYASSKVAEDGPQPETRGDGDGDDAGLASGARRLGVLPVTASPRRMGKIPLRVWSFDNCCLMVICYIQLQL